MRISTEEIQAMRDEYVGKKIRCLHMDDPSPVLDGMTGTCECVDDIGTVHCIWENGRRLGLIPGVDSFELVKED